MPGDRPERFAKAASSGADGIVIDLEDAVAPGAKDSAREATCRWLADRPEAVVRINGTATRWYDDDLAMVRRHSCAIMLPKANSADHVTAVSAQLASDTPLIALIETAAGIGAAREICATDGVARVAFGSVDLGAELGVDPDDHEALLYARSALVMASATAGGVAPLDGVTAAVHDDGAVAADSARAVRLGFGGKLCVHPRQLRIVNDTFSPTVEELDWARRIAAAARDGEVCVVDGRMVDKPVIDRAARLLVRADKHTSIHASWDGARV